MKIFTIQFLHLEVLANVFKLFIMIIKLYLIRDFAHSPSKLKASVDAVREIFTDSFIIAVYELHTFSSFNSNFINQYSGTLDNCDLLYCIF